MELVLFIQAFVIPMSNGTLSNTPKAQGSLDIFAGRPGSQGLHVDGDIWHQNSVNTTAERAP